MEKSHLQFNRLCPRQCCCQPHSRKHLLFPLQNIPTALQGCTMHHAGPWGLLAWAAAVAGEKGCWVALLSLQREIKWLPENVRGEGGYQKETHQSILSTALVLSAILGTWRVSQPHPQEYCLWRLVNSVFLTGLGFFCMDKSGSRPPSYLFVYAKHVLCHFTGHNQLHVQMQAWKTGGSPSSKLTITIILLSIKD